MNRVASQIGGSRRRTLRVAWNAVSALCILCCGGIRADEGLRVDAPLTEQIHTRYTKAEGLPSDWINDIIQTRDGYLWLGTDNGLVRYDGVRCKLFNGETYPQLPFDEIRALYEDTDRSLWIGTTRGVARYVLGRPARLVQVPAFAGKTVYAFLRDRRGRLWVGTQEETYVGNNEADFEPLADGPRNVRALCEDQQGRLWMGANEGLFCREGRTCRQILHDRLPKDAPLDESVPTRRINAIHCDQNGDLWIGTNRTLLHLRDGEFTLRGQELASQQIYDIARTRNGALYVAARFGVYRSVADRSFEQVLGEPSAFCLWEDPHGGLWIGYGDNRGLHCYRGSWRKSVWSDAHVHCIHADAEGALWFGTDLGLCRLRDGAIERMGVEQGLSDRKVIAIADARDGRLWLGTTKGFAQWSEQHGVVAAELPPAVDAMNIGVAFEDSTGSLWFALGTEGGFRVCRGRLHELSKLRSGRIHWFWEDASGAIWIGHERGLLQFSDGRIRRVGERDLERLRNPRFICHFASRDGTLWMGTSNGVARWRSGRLEAFPPECGLDADNIERLAADGEGNLWYGGRDGLFHARIDELDAFAEGRIAKVASHRVEGFERFPPVRAFSQACLPRDGELWLAQGGLVRLETRRLLEGHPPPGVDVEDITLDARGVEFGGPFRYRSGNRRLSIRFALQPFVDAGNVQVRYRLDPYDEDWTDAGDNRMADYTDLRPGDYAFRLSARHGNGPWVEAEHPPAFTVLPRWWETTLFRLLAALACVGLGLLYGSFRIRRMNVANASLRREIVARQRAEEQTRDYLSQLARLSRGASMGELASSIAHEVKQPLFAILTDAETAGRLLDGAEPDIDQVRAALQVISAGSRRVNEIVDRVRSRVSLKDQPRQPLCVNDVVLSVVGLLEAELRRRDVKLSLRLARGLPRVEGSAIELEQVLMNLVINGAQAIEKANGASRQVSITTSLDDEGVALVVSDTGNGLEAAEIAHVFEPFFTTREGGIGLGLAISRSIVRSHGGRIWAAQDDAGGAAFHITLPISRAGESGEQRRAGE